MDINELDSNYLKLNYTLTVLVRDSPIYSTIFRYVENTHASTHNQYKLEIDSIFELTPRKEDSFRADLPNKTWLWHGSRLTNFVGILNQGLRIAPP